jgi:hypothetical protein
MLSAYRALTKRHSFDIVITMTGEIAQGTTPNNSRYRRTITWASAGLFLVIVAGLAVVFVPRYQTRSAFLADERGRICAEAANLTNPPSPYGAIKSCRVLDQDLHLIGAVDANLYLWLETATGTVALRVDYRDTGAGRQYTAEAVELSAADTPGLSQQDAQRLRHDLDARGGLPSKHWTLHHGDG